MSKSSRGINVIIALAMAGINSVLLVASLKVSLKTANLATMVADICATPSFHPAARCKRRSVRLHLVSPLSNINNNKSYVQQWSMAGSLGDG